MENENVKEFEFIPITFEKENLEYIEEIYRLHKDQQRKIFDLGCNINDIMDYVEYKIKDNSAVVLACVDKSNGVVAGVITLESIRFFKNEIARCNVHIVVCRKYWGKTSREIIFQSYKWIDKNLKPIHRMEARVPANNFGVIKLLKDVGFKVEGTARKTLIFLDKHNQPKYYDELLFGRIKENG